MYHPNRISFIGHQNSYVTPLHKLNSKVSYLPDNFCMDLISCPAIYLIRINHTILKHLKEQLLFEFQKTSLSKPKPWSCYSHILYTLQNRNSKKNKKNATSLVHTYCYVKNWNLKLRQQEQKKKSRESFSDRTSLESVNRLKYKSEMSRLMSVTALSRTKITFMPLAIEIENIISISWILWHYFAHLTTDPVWHFRTFTSFFHYLSSESHSRIMVYVSYGTVFNTAFRLNINVLGYFCQYPIIYDVSLIETSQQKKKQYFNCLLALTNSYGLGKTSKFVWRNNLYNIVFSTPLFGTAPKPELK